MRADPFLNWNRTFFRRRVSSLVLFGIILGSGGCVDQSTDFSENSVARLSMGAVLPQANMAQAAFVDEWLVEVVRPGEGVIARQSGSIGPTESTVTLELTLTLNGFCESLSVLVELSRGGQPWFRSQATHEICSGRANELQVDQLQWVRPPATVVPGSLSFIVQEQQTASQSFSILYVGNDGLEWTASVEGGGAGWLSVQPSSGTVSGGQSAVVGVQVNAGNLAPGVYSASIQVIGEGFSGPIAQIPVGLTVTAGPRLGLSTQSLAFTVTEGFTPDPQSFLVTNPGGGTLTWAASESVDWLNLTPSSGSMGAGGSQMIAVAADPTELTTGLHNGVITVSGEGAGNSPQSIAVSLTVVPAPRIGLSTTALSFVDVEGSTPNPQLITVSNVGGGVLNWTVTDDAGWLSVQPEMGTLGAGLGEFVTVSVNTDNLPAGYYTANVTFIDPAAANSPRTLTVTLELTPQFVAPLLSGIGWSLTQLNDTTCWNGGTRFEIYFTYADSDGDILLSGSDFVGTPILLAWWFRPNGFTGSQYVTGTADGDSYSGFGSFSMCVAYEVEQNTSLDVTFRLMDSHGLLSNPLQTNLPRPDGANAPPPGSEPVGVGKGVHRSSGGGGGPR